MILGDTLRTTFNTAKPLTGENMFSAAALVMVVYRNGVAIAPPVPPVALAVAAGRYLITYPLTALNGHAAGDWVSVTVQATLDGLLVNVPVWEGNLVQTGADVTMIFNSTIYPLFTTHRPSTGANQAPDGGAAPVITVYRNLVPTGIVPVLANPAAGVYIMTLPLTAGAGWALGDEVDAEAFVTIDGLSRTGWVFSGGGIVAAGGGGVAGAGNVPHHEVIGHVLRFQ